MTSRQKIVRMFNSYSEKERWKEKRKVEKKNIKTVK